MSILYENLSKLCKERSITGYRMCKDLKIQPSIMTDLKMGRRSSVKAETAQKMAKYFGVTTDYLLGKSKFRNAHELIDYWGDAGPFFEAQFDFGGLVKQEREKQGLTIEEMAEFLGITPQDVIDCEDGALPINRELADQMAFFLGTNVSQMLFDNNLYPEEVPEEYHNNVAEWERLCEAAEREAAQEAKKAPTLEGERSIAQTEDEEDMLLLARHMEPIPEEDRKQLKEQFKKSIDLYLKARGLSGTEEK